MDNQYWQQIKDIFFAALDYSPQERPSFLNQACGSNANLRLAVEQFLGAYDEADSFLSAPAVNLSSDPHQFLFSHEISNPIGPYRILRELGQGGMGTVYLAERIDDFHQQVAIKLIKPGLGMAFTVQRLRAERQILASLEHPYIARLLDGGTTVQQLPYLVMEYVEGTPIDEYADRLRLSIENRLILFQKICQAVQYAHQNLIVHRDLKPGNILVNQDGVPKLLDFGIAKLLNPNPIFEVSADLPLTALRMMTPQYASPEQVRGETITTASDVYSLGVILYELLCGHPPYRVTGSTFHEIEQAICEQTPMKPSLQVAQTMRRRNRNTASNPLAQTTEVKSQLRSTRPERLSKQLQGDLDTIVLKALHKDPSRRYRSVEQLSDDLSRHLQGLPVLAQPDTFSYRMAKFLKRNRGGVAASLLMILTLLGGIAATSWQADRARTQQAKAERRFNDVRKLAQSLLQEVSPKISMAPDSLPVQKLLVEKTRDYLDSTARESDGDPALQRELAMAYCQIGDIEGNPYAANLGDTTAAIQNYRKAQVLIEKLVSADPQNLEYLYTLATCYTNMGEVFSSTGDIHQALSFYEKGLPFHEKVALGRKIPDTRIEWMVANCRFGNILSYAGQSEAATAAYLKAVQISDRLVAENPADENTRRLQAGMYQRFGEQVLNTGNPEDARLIFEKSRLILEQILAQHPDYLLAQKGLNGIYENSGNALLKAGKTAEAVTCFTEMVRNTEKQLARDPENIQCWVNQASGLSNLAEALAAEGKKIEALSKYQKTLALVEKLSATDPHNMNFSRAVFNTRLAIGQTLMDLNRQQDAFTMVRAIAVEIENLAPPKTQNIYFQATLAQAFILLGKLQNRMRQPHASRTSTLRGLAIQKKLADSSSALIDQLERYATSLNTCEPADLRNPTEAQHYTARANTMKNRRLSNLGAAPLPTFEARH